jgi:SAM-dependent methyltransferase
LQILILGQSRQPLTLSTTAADKMTSIVAPADSFVLVIGDQLSDLAQTISQQTKNVTVKQYSDNLVDLRDSSLDLIVSAASTAVHHLSEKLSLLFEFLRLLKPNGKLILREPAVNRTADVSEKLAANLTLSGFVNTQISNVSDQVQVSSAKPSWEVGAASSIQLKKKAKSAWSVDAHENSELLDEDKLLDESDLVRPTKGDDCELTDGARKACKNCTCGRAEGESSNNKLTLEMIESPAVNSSCGNCALGDAFRCGGCPYRGLPAFKPGEKIKLPDDFVMDDI